MAIPTTVTYGGLNLNAGPSNNDIGFTLRPGFDPGSRVRTFEEYRGYTGSIAQYNVSDMQLVQMTVPLRAHGSNLTGLNNLIEQLNAVIDAGPRDFVYHDGSASVTYEVVWSTRPTIVRDNDFQSAFWTEFDLILNRLP